MRHVSRFLSQWVLLAFLSSTGTVALAQDEPRDPADLAAKVAPDIAKAIKAKFPGNQVARVVVFPAANSAGQVTMATATPAVSLQGELIQQLRKLSLGKFTVLSRKQMADAIKSGGDPAGIVPDNTQTTAEAIKDLSLDVAVQPHFDKLTGGSLAVQLNFSFKLVFADKTDKSIDITTPGTVVAPPNIAAPTGPENPASGRFRVDIIVDGQPLPMKRVNEPDRGVKLDSDGKIVLGPDGLPIVVDQAQAERHLFHNVYVVEIPATFVTQEKPFQIRLTNKGTPTVRWENAPNKEKDRLYAVSLLVDGVSSFMKDTGQVDAAGKPLFDFEVVFPKDAWKWVLSGPGKRAVGDETKPSPDKPGAFLHKLVDAPGAGGSVVDVPGFQKTKDNAAQFLFGLAKDSPASLVGVINDIGIIRADFYPEDLTGDSEIINASPVSGVKPGNDVASKVVPIFFPRKRDPVEVWSIFYRVQGEKLPPGNKVPVTN
jgi:hypothetical protein